MGITISYRGRLAELERIEDFEDRLLDFALEVGGAARIWRSWADSDPDRMVRGIILDLAPGQESTSLLVSSEGWLIGITDIEDAEEVRLEEPPWCFTKTRFGPVEGHVAIVEMLAALKRHFVPDLDVSDDGGYGRCVVQLKRALRGTAFARGALFPLRPILSEEQFHELFRVLQQMETDIVSELGRVRSR